MVRRALLPLIAVSLLLAGCPGDWLIADDSDNSNIISTSRGGTGGGANFTGGTNTGSSGGSTTPFSCTGLRVGIGVESDAAAGTNPSSVSLSDSVQVMPLYLGSNVSMSVSNAKTAVVAMASLNETSDSYVQATWSGSGVGTAYRTQSESALDESPQNRAERLVREHAKTLRPAPVSTSYRTQAGTTYANGAERTFKILDFRPGMPARSVPTKAVHVYNAPTGQKGSFVIWVDQEDVAIFQGSGSKLETIANELRERIYKLDTCAFGSDTTIAENDALPASKKVYLDDDYVHFVFSRRVDNGTLTTGNGTLGFFTLADLADSGFNRGKILYIASSATSRSLGDMFAVIAHEFQHLLFSCHRVKAVGMQNHIYEFQSGADTWLNEGLSMLAMMLNGYGPDGSEPSPAIVQQIADYLDEPSKYSMTEFYQGTGNPTDAYGMVTLFVQYLNDRLGDASLKDFHSTDNSATMFNGQAASAGNVDPTDLADRVLAKYGTTLGRMFADFGAAVVLDGSEAVASLDEPWASRYQIRNVNLRGKYTGLEPEQIQMQGPGVQVQASTNLSLRPYCLNFLYQKNLSGTISLGFTGGGGSGYGAKLILTQ